MLCALLYVMACSECGHVHVLRTARSRARLALQPSSSHLPQDESIERHGPKRPKEPRQLRLELPHVLHGAREAGWLATAPQALVHAGARGAHRQRPLTSSRSRMLAPVQALAEMVRQNMATDSPAADLCVGIAAAAAAVVVPFSS